MKARGCIILKCPQFRNFALSYVHLNELSICSQSCTKGNSGIFKETNGRDLNELHVFTLSC